MTSVIVFSATTCWGQGTVSIEEAPPALSPAAAAQQFNVADGLEIKLVVAEPRVSQPLSISFDDRGRMWVLQYLQFPNPNGLKPVAVDNWLRTKYDTLPEPPPAGPKGGDRISIYEDTDGDGQADNMKHFVADLNLASGMALGYGGVFVVQPPYLLFYPDRNQDDVPDGDPEVLLTGFGMEDAHAFANSLTWGPDGWLYGAQGSTATADIRGVGFQQGVWRYHPRSKVFELFSEGGGNTWGIDFDALGNLFSAGNTVEPLVHHVQDAYYVKGFGKHGPLHNPHAYGYFQPVTHHGYVGDSLTGGFVLYQGGAFPERFNDACIAPNTRHSAMRWSTLHPRGSTFDTRAAGDFITTSDIWFRPVDSTVGPDGALYVADWYDYNISHSSPKNRSEWYQPSRADGRVWRVAPPGVPPMHAGQLDLAANSNEQLIDLLTHPNDWYVRQARRLLAERRDPDVAAKLHNMVDHQDQRLALQALWSIYVSGGLDETLAVKTLHSAHEYIRAWTVRLLADDRRVSPQIAGELVRLASQESSVIVRSQLACSAKRLPADVGIPLAAELVRYDEDVTDPHIPLLLWWAVEDKAISDASLVLNAIEPPKVWQTPIVQEFILERLARRLTAEGTESAFAACARLLSQAQGVDEMDRLLTGMAKALSGRKLEAVPAAMQATLNALFEKHDLNPRLIELSLRMGAPATAAVQMIEDASVPIDERLTIIRVLGETRPSTAVNLLLGVMKSSTSESIQSAVISALASFPDDHIAAEVISRYANLSPACQSQAIDLLCGRPHWAIQLLKAIDAKTIDARRIELDQVRQLLALDDERILDSVTKYWGRVKSATPLEKQGRITAVAQLLGRGTGELRRGIAVFEQKCASCHKLHGKGALIGPDLTGAERKDIHKLLENIVDPSAVIRPEYLSHVAATTDGRVITGLLAESTPDTITLLDAKNSRTIISRTDLEELRESPASLMPEGILDDLADQQIRDLLAYLQSDGPSN